MTTALLRRRGAASPTRTRRRSNCARVASRAAALLLGLQLTALAPPLRAELDIDRLVFEARLLSDPPLPPSPPAATAAPLSAADAAVPEPGTMLAGIAGHNQRIAELEATQGSFAPGLVQEYLDLGRRYQSLGRHDAAIEAFEDAEHVSRINDGLVNATLFPIIEASLESHLARGELFEFGQKQQTLYELARAHYGPGSAELVPLLVRLGDWQVTSFRRSLQRQPVMSISFGGGGSIDPRRAGFGNLRRAQRHYAEAVAHILQREEVSSPDLLPLEQKFLQTLYLEANRNGLLENPDFFLGGHRSATGSRIRQSEMHALSAAFVNGRSAYQRMRFYAAAQRQPLLQQAALLVAEADWHLLFSHHGAARRKYQDARAMLQAAGIAEAEQAALLAPVLPQQLPAFAALPHSRAHFGLADDAALAWEGWIDVSFELSRYGKPQRLKVLGSSPGTARAVQGRLRRLLLSSPFRPRIDAAEAQAPHVYRVRYYYAPADSRL